MQPHAHGTVITTDNVLAPLIPTIFLSLCTQTGTGLSQLSRMKGEIGNKCYDMLLDSGSSISLINENIVCINILF